MDAHELHPDPARDGGARHARPEGIVVGVVLASRPPGAPRVPSTGVFLPLRVPVRRCPGGFSGTGPGAPTTLCKAPESNVSGGVSSDQKIL
jgi:hypothetical protein